MASCGVVPEQCSANRVFRGGPMRCCPVLGLSSLNFPRLRQQFASDELEGHGWHSGGRSQLEVLLLEVAETTSVALLWEARQVQQPRGSRGSLRSFTGALELRKPTKHGVGKLGLGARPSTVEGVRSFGRAGP